MIMGMVMMWVCFIFGLFSFFFNRKNVLMLLLNIEFIVLIMFLIIYFYLSFLGDDIFISMFFITFSVCGACLGLSLLVSMIRLYGNESVNFFNLKY